jgi:hypothetical protein
MTKPQIQTKYEMSGNITAIEKVVAIVIIKKRKHLKNLKKLKDYLSMNKCIFRDEQINKMLNGEKNG